MVARPAKWVSWHNVGLVAMRSNPTAIQLLGHAVVVCVLRHVHSPSISQWPPVEEMAAEAAAMADDDVACSHVNFLWVAIVRTNSRASRVMADIVHVVDPANLVTHMVSSVSGSFLVPGLEMD